MDVQIDELHSTVEAVGAQSLPPDLVRRLVALVMAELQHKSHQETDRDEDLDTRSVVEQQRAGRR